MLTRRRTAALLAAAALALPLAAAVPASAAASAPPPPCAAGYAEWYVTNGTNQYYLDAEGINNKVEVTGTPTCWHAPSQGNIGEFKDNSLNCLNFDEGIGGYEIMLACNSSINSENWDASTSTTFQNEYAIDQGYPDTYLCAVSISNGADVTLCPADSGARATWRKA